MKSKEINTGVIVNFQAGNKREIKRSLKPIEQSFDDAKVYEIADLEGGNIQNIPPKLVIVGGDGTVRASLSWLASHDEYPQILIAGSGSTNTFRSALMEEGAKTSAQAVKKGNLIGIDYKPAVIEHEDGERDFWVIAAGFGEFEKGFPNAFEGVRRFKIPPQTRAHTAGLMVLVYNFLTAMSSRDPLIQAYTTGQHIGPFKVFKENELSLSSDKLGLVEIDKKGYYWRILRFIISSMFWQTGTRPPKFLASTKISESFTTNLKSLDDTSPVNLDGDEKSIQSGKVSIKRHPFPFPTSALIWKKNRRF